MYNGRCFVEISDLVIEPTTFQGGDAPTSYTATPEISVPLNPLSCWATQPARTIPHSRYFGETGHQLTDQIGHPLYSWKCSFKPMSETNILETSRPDVKYFHIAKDVERRS